jgi:hypothetical protein
VIGSTFLQKSSQRHIANPFVPAPLRRDQVAEAVVAEVVVREPIVLLVEIVMTTVGERTVERRMVHQASSVPSSLASVVAVLGSRPVITSLCFIRSHSQYAFSPMTFHPSRKERSF